MTDPTVVVRGEASLDAWPEVAEFSASVRVQHNRRSVALSHLEERLAAVRALLDQHADVIERRETSQLWVSADAKHEDATVSYHAHVTTSVVMRDLGVVGDVMMRVAELADVAGPNWSLRDDSPVYRQARHAALADAIVRARDYADALGARLTGLLELSEVGARDGEYRAVPLAMAASAAGPSIELDRQLLTVRATVVARFAISEPTLLD
ncbi:MAG TPA: SIMPL domain-containing protein [Micromonosporaceae bacterium]|jgi:hypothetical protein